CALSRRLLVPESADRVGRTLLRLASFVERRGGVTVLSQVAPADVEAFVRARSLTGDEPSAAMMHHRRSSVRLLFRMARLMGIDVGDPTLDVDLPPRSSLPCRPLTDAEVALCRSWSLHTLRDTRQPAAWALAETGARTSELPHLRASDVDLDTGSVWVQGSPRLEP